MNINPTLLFLIGEVIILTMVFSWAIYLYFNLKKTSKRST